MDVIVVVGGGTGGGTGDGESSWNGGDRRCMDGVRWGVGAREALTLVRMLLWCVGVVMVIGACFVVKSASMSR
jgi:hypothetical protein